ncbi:exopolyphosphatase 1 [Lachnospiraceae bacterium]|nr:exopolyphosphatase 1 [Lachnospiraceae bacterium]
MSVKTFAAIDIGSYELAMKIFEVSQARGMREIDHIRHSIDMGTETYGTGKLSYERVDELCHVLREFSDIMKSYQVEEYQAYGTSAIRESRNRAILIDQIEQRTGIHIDVLGNSEQRFLDYKSIAFQGEGFQKIIENGTAILDIGGGSIQISLFDNDTLVSTQNMRLGVLRLQERLDHLDVGYSQYEMLIREIVESQMNIYNKLYLKDRQIKSIIVVDDYISALVARKAKDGQKGGFADKKTMEYFARLCRTKSLSELSKALDMPEETILLLMISMILLRCIMENMGAEQIWAPGVTLSDGIAYEYAEKNKIITSTHDFEKDIIACAKNISKRYRGSKKRGETLERIALTIFDSMKKVHGLGARERLLLQISTILHDCGKYISMANLGECSYSIIMATEIIGLSYEERQIVANVVKYNHLDFDYYETSGSLRDLDKEAYLKIAKLTAILRIANGLDRSHKQKFKNVKVALKEYEMVITVNTQEDITLEKGLFGARADFFEEVYNIRPVIRKKKI